MRHTGARMTMTISVTIIFFITTITIVLRMLRTTGRHKARGRLSPASPTG